LGIFGAEAASTERHGETWQCWRCVAAIKPLSFIEQPGPSMSQSIAICRLAAVRGDDVVTKFEVCYPFGISTEFCSVRPRKIGLGERKLLSGKYCECATE
jgi:hypothetical protein